MNRVCRVRLRTGFFAPPIWCAERTLLALLSSPKGDHKDRPYSKDTGNCKPLQL